MQLTGTIGDTTYTLTGEPGSLQGPEFLVKAFEGLDNPEDVLRHARLLFGESLKIDHAGTETAAEGRPATDPERRAVAQGTPNQPDPVSVAETQITDELKQHEEEAAEAPQRARRQRE